MEPWVDVPYGRDEIVEAGALRLGPNFAPLAPVVGRMAIVHGVALRTANHNTGSEQFLRMKTGTRPEMPSLLQLLGEHRDGQAVGCMDWLFGAAQFNQLFGGMPPEDLRRLGGLLRAQAKRLRRRERAGEAGHGGEPAGVGGSLRAHGGARPAPGRPRGRPTRARSSSPSRCNACSGSSRTTSPGASS